MRAARARAQGATGPSSPLLSSSGLALPRQDLLLGPATMCRGRSAFEAALAWHPAFLGATLANALPPSLSRRLPDLTLVVDSVSEDVARGTVGVEWHVEVSLS